MTPQVIQNLIPEIYQKELEDTLFKLPFYYSSSIGYDEKSIKSYGTKFLDNIGFSHSLIMDGNVDSNYWFLFKPILYFLSQEIKLPVVNVIRARLRLTFQHPERKNFIFNKPHVDLPNYDNYKTLILYLNDSDGDTFIFDKYYNKFEASGSVLKDIDKKIIFKQTPKRGNGVYFDGRQYHAGNSPINYKSRYLINFDFTV
tara:strand:- start:2642 stop:3241 length:600 start_codon:yes stop_codon:yes gene_type:complete